MGFTQVGWGQTLYFGGSGTWNDSVWSTTNSAPYTIAWTSTSAAIFNVTNSTITGATTQFSTITANEDVTVSAGGTLGTSGTVATIAVASGKTFNFGNQVISSTAGTGFNKNGLGTVKYGSAGGGTYNGGYTLTDGTVVLGGAINSLGAAGALSINGGTLAASANHTAPSGKYSNITIGGDFTFGNSTNTANITFADNVSLGNSTTRTITLGSIGIYALNGIISGTSSSIILNATALGYLVFGGANTYNGGTTITAGTLVLGATGVLVDAGTVTLNGGTLKTGATVGFSETAGTLNLSDNSTIALGSGIHSLNFAASNEVSWTSGKILTITGWTGTFVEGSSGTAGKIFVGSDATGLTSSQLDQIKFTIGSVDYSAMMLSTGEIVPNIKFEENFDYGGADNADLVVASSSSWTNHNGTGNPGYGATGLTYAGYASSGIGGNATFTNVNGGDINKTFSTVGSNANIYVSFLVNLASANATDDYFFHVGPTSIGTTFRGRIFARSNGAGWSVSLSKSNETAAVDNTILNLNQTYLVILKYVFSTATTSDDQVGLWIYDSGVPSSEGSGTPVVTIGLTGNGTASDPSDLGTVAIRQNTTTPIGSIDGIRVGTSWGQAPLPVELTSFSASVQNKTVNLTWHTATEVNNYGFEVERISNEELGIRNWNKVGFVNGAGNSNSPKEYSFTDKSAASGKYLYRLKQLDNDGQYSYSKEVEVDLGSPTAFALEQNYPNPFNPTTSIQYSVVGSQNVTIKVFNVLGKEVAVLVNEKQEPGTYTVEFSTANLASGTYIYRMQAGEFVQTKKMIVLK